MRRYRGSVPLHDDWQHFRFEVADRVATVTLDRPEKLNPFTFESYADLRDLLHELPHRGDADVLVIRGAGKGFCGGGDVGRCAASLWAALDEAAGELTAAQGADPSAWRADATKERIVFAPGILTRTMRGSNKPTFQQAVTFSTHR